MLDDKSRLVDYDHSPEENMIFYIEKENQHKSYWSRKWTQKWF